MNYNEEKKKENIKLVVLLISFFVLVGIGVFFTCCYYQDTMNNSSLEELNDKDDNSSSNDESNNITIDGVANENGVENSDIDDLREDDLYLSEVDSKFVKDIVAKVDTLKIVDYINYNPSSPNLFGYIYQRDKLFASELDSNVRTHLVASYLVKDILSDKNFEILLDEFKKNWMLVFGKESDFNFSDSLLGNIVVEQQNNKIIIYYTGDVVGDCYQIFSKYMKVEKNVDSSEIYLYEVIAIADLDGTNSGIINNKKSTYDFYSDLERQNIVAQDVTIEEIFSSKNLNNLLQYKYTFKLEDDNYYFYSVERAK